MLVYPQKSSNPTHVMCEFPGASGLAWEKGPGPGPGQRAPAVAAVAAAPPAVDVVEDDGAVVCDVYLGLHRATQGVVSWWKGFVGVLCKNWGKI